MDFSYNFSITIIRPVDTTMWKQPFMWRFTVATLSPLWNNDIEKNWLSENTNSAAFLPPLRCYRRHTSMQTSFCPASGGGRVPNECHGHQPKQFRSGWKWRTSKNESPAKNITHAVPCRFRVSCNCNNRRVSIWETINNLHYIRVYTAWRVYIENGPRRARRR